jgi:hypothetical protein
LRTLSENLGNGHAESASSGLQFRDLATREPQREQFAATLALRLGWSSHAQLTCIYINSHISFEFVRQQLRGSYSETGRPSIDPELLLRMLLIGYLYGITSERKLVEELRMHLAWRWFTGLGFDQEIPHHSTFSAISLKFRLPSIRFESEKTIRPRAKAQ